MCIRDRYTALWFNADKLGDFHVFCTEFCGTSHSGMITKLRVLSKTDFDKWLTEEADVKMLPVAERGQKTFNKVGCAGCHNVSGTEVKIGPSLSGLFGLENHALEEGTVKADENYIRESILNPQAKLAKNFPLERVRMTSFQGSLSEGELTALIEYIKTLK